MVNCKLVAPVVLLRVKACNPLAGLIFRLFEIVIKRGKGYAIGRTCGTGIGFRVEFPILECEYVGKDE